MCKNINGVKPKKFKKTIAFSVGIVYNANRTFVCILIFGGYSNVR